MTSRPHEFLTAWAEFEPGRAEFKPGKYANVLTGDDELLRPAVSKRHIVLHDSWDDLISEGEFGARDTRLHLALLPQPFFGNLCRASVFILTLNPGLHPVDYYAEFRVPEYKRALMDTLRQQIKGRYPFIWFDPRFSWHSGFSYWHGRFAGLIDTFARDGGVRRVEAMSFFAKSLATIELLPYHSASFGLRDRIVNKLRSVRLARSFVSEVLAPRAQAGRILLVVARHAAAWGLRQGRNTIVYKGPETRGAHLTPRSRGGKAILKHLKAAWSLTRSSAREGDLGMMIRAEDHNGR